MSTNATSKVEVSIVEAKARNHNQQLELVSTKGTAIIRFKDLEAVWYLPRAKEPGFMRWLVTWVGGPPGYVNPSLGTSATSNNMAVGFMSLPRGQRQEGLHAHTVAEIYVIQKGQLMGWDGRGESHLAGPGDCIYIPAGVPHGVRCYGSVDAELIWIHDGIERKGAAVYFTGPGPFPQADEIQVIPFKGLEPNYNAIKAKEPEFMRWHVSYVGGTKTQENHSPALAIQSRNIHIGLLALAPAQKEVPSSSPQEEVYILLDGKVILNHGTAKGEDLEKFDGIFYGSGETHAVRNYGSETAYILTVKSFH